LKNTNKTAALYIRVSTLQQVDRDSLNTQEERLKRYCEYHDFNNYKVYREEGVSAKDTNRPKLEELKRDINTNVIDHVIVTKLDRITRSIRDLFKLTDYFEEKNVNFITTDQDINTKTSTGRFTLYLFGLLAQLERETTSERVSTDMRHRASSGKWNGGLIPHGYCTQGSLVKDFKNDGLSNHEALLKATQICPISKKLYINHQEAKNIKLIFKTFLKENSIRKTTQILNNSGIKTRNDKFWATSSIHRILSNPTYEGKIWYGKRKTNIANGRLEGQDKSDWTIVEGDHKAIIEHETFRKAQSLLEQNKGKPAKKGRTYLLSGLIKCAKCGGSMSGYSFTKKGTDKKYSYYKCSTHLSKGKIACEGLSIPANEIEGFLVDELKKLSKTKSFLNNKDKMISMLKSKKESDENDFVLEKIEKRIKDVEKRNERLIDKLEKGLIDDELLTTRFEKNKRELNNLEKEKTKLLSFKDSNSTLVSNLKASFEAINSFGFNWEFLDEKGKQLRLKSIIKQVKASKEEIEMELYLDVVKVSHKDTGSWRPPA